MYFNLATGDILLVTFLAMFGTNTQIDKVECWDIFELTLQGPSNGNPFEDIKLNAKFKQDDRVIEVEGFYDGDGVYKVRFMPDHIGKWTYITNSNNEQLNSIEGSFICTEAGAGNHGPVRVHNIFQLAYTDGTPHFSVGTTCYAWVHQGNEMEELTLETLSKSPFNKIRMCVFPKSYVYNNNEPEYYPYEGKPLRDWNFRRFNPAFWHHFEKRVKQLRDIGIEADIIIFHPYDRWGFKEMGHENNLFYLRYLVARLSAFRNVWWSFANEYDFLNWQMEHWDEYIKLVQKIDPYDHLRGIHNGRDWYDHTKPWITHASIQDSNFKQAKEYRERYNKPIIYDECRYEGNIPQGWGNISAKQMTRNFWMGSLAGCYVGHGETYKHPEDLLWWAKGGVLYGQSPARIQYMKDIIEALPYQDMKPDFSNYPDVYIMAKEGEAYLMYFTSLKPVVIYIPGENIYKLDGIDTWEMKTITLGSANSGTFSFTPPKQDYAIRLVKYMAGEKLRPEAKLIADKTDGEAPLTVKFSTNWEKGCYWDFGDSGSSIEKAPVHTFEKPGSYIVTLKITDDDGVSVYSMLPVIVDRKLDDPVVKFGFPDDNYPEVIIHGDKIIRKKDGTYDMGSGKPFTWIQLGDEPIRELEGAKSFTIIGWLKASSMEQGSGGNRIVFNLQYNTSGIDLVHHADGRMRLAVNEWPDNIRNDSTEGMVQLDKWIFFAVTYDSSKHEDSVHWYFGDENKLVQLDRKTNYNNGPVGLGTGDLVIGNFNETLQSAGLDRQFRGQIRRLRIYASRLDNSGALSMDKITNIWNQDMQEIYKADN